ncbi:putative subtilase-type serine protease [Halomicronema hongdechloris C2206]|uniref:Subtilase-type serine protease n=1 Tax=Halomicronema hongdechloris C2206 TaxID=1641165 RepID=A0A1Z3HPJ7_9CYAN|nr:DVUA0089 family protein [Halomicronema hongdechloris]ASC72215.1 putative subtilase-type serine protease [Halomicronema hongdechloris C2206]
MTQPHTQVAVNPCLLLINLIGWGLVGSFSLPSLAANSPLPALQETLQLALCLNDRQQAIAALGPLLAHSEITPAYRQQLVTLRHYLEHPTLGQVGVERQTCDRTLARYLPVDFPGEADQALLLALGGRRRLPHQQAAQAAALERSGIARTEVIDLAALSPVTPIDTEAGSGVTAGAVKRGQEVFSFVAQEGDQITLEVEVTQILTGTLYTDDDSQLFLFDDQGRLLAENDDFRGLESTILRYSLPRTGTYYVAVTTYNNDPVLDENNVVVDWIGSGGSHIEFVLTVEGVTPLEELQRLPPAGGE